MAQKEQRSNKSVVSEDARQTKKKVQRAVSSRKPHTTPPPITASNVRIQGWRSNDVKSYDRGSNRTAQAQDCLTK